jgi:hypothetical protein
MNVEMKVTVVGENLHDANFAIARSSLGVKPEKKAAALKKIGIVMTMDTTSETQTQEEEGAGHLNKKTTLAIDIPQKDSSKREEAAQEETQDAAQEAERIE